MKCSIAVILLIHFYTCLSPDKAFGETTNSALVYVCRDRAPNCRIVVPYGEAFGVKAWQEAQLQMAQALQTYINKLSGVVLPIEMSSSNDTIQGSIEFVTAVRSVVLPYCYNISSGFRTPKSFAIVLDGNGPDCAKLALSNFVETAFGPPLSAIDDPNYKWPRQSAITVDLQKFRDIKRTH